MPIRFSADEIFEMAEEIERNGAKFYRRASKFVSDRGLRQMFLELVEMEVEHIQTFSRMREQLSDEDRQERVFDPDNQMALYLQAMADGHVFDMKKDLSEQLTGDESAADILRLAIEAEKDSIIYYSGLKWFVPESAGRSEVERIIVEEMSHISQLSEKLKALT